MTTMQPVSLSALSEAHHAAKPKRAIYTIAWDIRDHWLNVHYAALPYLKAMNRLTTLADKFGEDSAKSIILYFLANAKTWRGEDARRIKAELKALIER